MWVSASKGSDVEERESDEGDMAQDLYREGGPPYRENGKSVIRANV